MGGDWRRSISDGCSSTAAGLQRRGSRSKRCEARAWEARQALHRKMKAAPDSCVLFHFAGTAAGLDGRE